MYLAMNCILGFERINFWVGRYFRRVDEQLWASDKYNIQHKEAISHFRLPIPSVPVVVIES